MGKQLRVAAAGLSAWLAIGLAGAAWAQGSGELARRQAEARRQQESLRERIQSLQQQIDARESDRKEAADALRKSERAISELNRRLAELSEDIAQARAELAKLEADIKRQSADLAERRDALGRQMRAQYATGLSPWTALLSGDDPQALGRNLSYLDYLSQARAGEVSTLRREVDRLEALRERERKRRADLQGMQQETGQRRDELAAQQKERATVLARLDGQLKAQRAEAGRLDRDDQRLGGLVSQLGQQVDAARREEARIRAEEERKRREAEEARRRAEAEAARKQAEEARQKAEQARLAAEAARRDAAQRQSEQEGARRAQAQREADEAQRLAHARQAERLAQQAGQAGRPAAEPRQDEAALRSASRPGALDEASGLRAGLPMPVQGSVMARFGTARPDGGNWRGILLKAPEGAPVKAVAAGTVVYADWLRGFGNLLIVDHGQQFMSVYAYNQGLLKKVGDVVRAGDTVATVGATGGQVDSGLYFEIRHRGAPQDPAKFFAAR